MGVNPVSTSKGQNASQDVQQKNAEQLAVPDRGAVDRGSVAQRIMSASASTKESQGSAIYRVRSGDNPSVIAERFKVPLREIFAANPELDPNKMQIGQAIRLPGVTQNFHIIQKGETLGAIAAANHVSLKDLQEANPKVEPRSLQIGQAIFLPVLTPKDVRPAPAPSPSPSPRGEPVKVAQPSPPIVKTEAKPQSSAPDAGHSAAWRHIPVDPKLLNSRYVCELHAAPAPNFFVSAIRSLGHEGGLTTNGNDMAHQGAVKCTNYGVTGMAMSEYIKSVEGVKEKPSAQELTDRIKSLTYGEALDIYASNYWQREYQSIDKKVSFLLFDWAIIGGAKSTLMRVQDALGVAKTGKMDPETVKAMNDIDSGVLCAKITQLRIARHRERVEEVKVAIKKWDDIKEAGGTPKGDRPKDQSEFLAGWIDRALKVNTYTQSAQFKQLTEVFERTAPQGADLMDPVRAGAIPLKKGSAEPALVRMLQQRLSSVGYPVKEDGKFEKEMTAVVDFFQEHYNLPRQPTWGPNEMRVLDALMVGKQLREQPMVAANVGPRR